MFGTYIPICLVAIGGALGWIIFSIICFVTIIGITLSIIDVDSFKLIEVLCHLINGWGSLAFIKVLLVSIGTRGVFYLILGGVMYTVGSILYAIGSKKKYYHCIFHIFCLLGTFFHFITIFFS